MTVILTPDDVRGKYGRLFCQGLYTMVDEKNGKALILERCTAKGPVEWDAVNRRRAGGAVEDIRVEGSDLLITAVIGSRPINFGPAAKDVGGQGLKSVEVEGDEVVTTWAGLAGASVGIGACLPQAPGVISSEYPDDAKIGGAHGIEVRIRTPKMVRMVYGVDDTDTKEKGASWALMLQMAREATIGQYVEHKIVQLNPDVPEKTTNCVSVAVTFAVEEAKADQLTEWVASYIKERTLSDNTVLAVFQGISVPEPLKRYGLKAKANILDVEEARRAAAEGGVRLIEITGPRGAIGAVAAVGCADMGWKAAGLIGDIN